MEQKTKTKVFNQIRNPFKDRSPLYITFLILLIVGSFTAVFFYDKIFGEKSIFYTHVSDVPFFQTLFEMIPSVIASIETIAFSMLAFNIIRFILKQLSHRNKKMETITRLLLSFAKYLIGIIAFLILLYSWGVDVTTLLASAGILSLVIGLGAQSLIADIIAGVFIVFEGAYEVGDIVVIDGWRGTITEVGIRSTRILDDGNNVKIINNSAITSVINLSKMDSVAKCTMSIDYDESVERVEQIFANNIQRIKDKIPAITDGPYYKGVSELADSSIDLFYIAKCKEQDIYQVQRDLKRELFLIFSENNVNIPFNQLVVSTRDDSDKKEEK